MKDAYGSVVLYLGLVGVTFLVTIIFLRASISFKKKFALNSASNFTGYKVITAITFILILLNVIILLIVTRFSDIFSALLKGGAVLFFALWYSCILYIGLVDMKKLKKRSATIVE